MGESPLRDLTDRIASATRFDLSHPYRVGMPQSPNHVPFRMLLERRHGDMVRADGGSAANEVIVLGGHVGTHLDALAHVSQDGFIHGGIPAAQLQSQRGFSRLGIDDFAPYAGRAVVLDVAAVHGVEVLPAGYEVTAADLEAARERAGVPIGAGEVILIGTGWSRNWNDPEVMMGLRGGVPGPGAEAGEWLAQQQPVAVGGEGIAFEQIKAGAGHGLLPVHRILLVEHGINIVEAMNLDALLRAGCGEFLLILNPLLVAGATGAPVRPIALAL